MLRRGIVATDATYNKSTAEILERLFSMYHSPAYINPDPLQLVIGINSVDDREIVALIAASLALGRVSAIIKIVTTVTERLSSTPSLTIDNLSEREIYQLFSDLKYRFFAGDDIADLIVGIKSVRANYGNLNALFIECLKSSFGNFIDAQEFFIKRLSAQFIGGRSLLALPSKKSACKRFNLFLKWMVRSDSVDPGGWSGVSKSDLIIPLDTHIHQIGKILGFTNRKVGDLKTAIEITEALKLYDSEDPTRFDFSLSRLGIHPDLSYEELKRG